VIDVIRELESYGMTVHVHDPVASPREAWHEYGVELVQWEHLPRANAIVAAVAHDPLVARTPEQIAAKLVPGGLYVDVKARADAAALKARGLQVWRL
jgi:UDP-N-acetyl-D-galactosamine dehydrogenase